MNIGIKKKIMALILIVILISSCTRKKNYTGVPDSNLKIHKCTINSEHLNKYFSYEDSTKNINSNKLLLGNYKNIESKALLRFIDLPDSVSYVESAKLSLKIKDSFNFNNIIDASNIKIGKITDTKWYENSVTWNVATDSTEWENTGFSSADYTDYDLGDIYNEGDSLCLSLPNEMVEDWIISDSLNYGMVLYTPQDSSFIEIYSTETDEHPILEFDFFNGDSLVHFVSDNKSAYDSFIFHKINDEELQIFSNEIKLSNIIPTRTFLKFDISSSLFTQPDASGIDFTDDQASGIENDEQYRRMKINNAKLILYRNMDDAYPLGGNYSIKPYLMINDKLDSEEPDYLNTEYSDDYISYENATYDTLLLPKIEIDVTNIVQSMVSGSYDNLSETNIYENNGILIRSTYENQDFNFIEFYDKNSEIYYPRLKIVYTPPYGIN